jgi:hypothetical protein
LQADENYRDEEDEAQSYQDAEDEVGLTDGHFVFLLSLMDGKTRLGP